jgi:hypothetical protein
MHLVDAGWDDAKVVQPDGCGQARRGVVGVDPTPPWQGGAMTPLQKLGPPPAPPVFPAIGAAHLDRTVHFSPSFLRTRYA